MMSKLLTCAFSSSWARTWPLRWSTGRTCSRLWRRPGWSGWCTSTISPSKSGKSGLINCTRQLQKMAISLKELAWLQTTRNGYDRRRRLVRFSKFSQVLVNSKLSSCYFRTWDRRWFCLFPEDPDFLNQSFPSFSMTDCLSWLWRKFSDLTAFSTSYRTEAFNRAHPRHNNPLKMLLLLNDCWPCRSRCSGTRCTETGARLAGHRYRTSSRCSWPPGGRPRTSGWRTWRRPPRR